MEADRAAVAEMRRAARHKAALTMKGARPGWSDSVGVADGPGGDGAGAAGMGRLDRAILEAAADIRCDVCRALAREVFVQSSEAANGGAREITEESIFARAHSSCQGQVPPLLQKYSVLPRPHSLADSPADTPIAKVRRCRLTL